MRPSPGVLQPPDATVHPITARLSTGQLVFWLLLCANLCLRIALFSFRSSDVNADVEPWYEFIRTHGGFEAFGEKFSNYAPAYLYLLWLAGKTPLPIIYAVKAVSTVFDFVIAFLVKRIVEARRPALGWAFFLVALFSPTAILNSALWGQCDAIYTAFAVLALWLLINRQEVKGSLAFGAACAFKLQAAFLAPTFLLWAAARWLKPRMLIGFSLLVGATYIVTIVPPWLAGRSFVDLMTVYLQQYRGNDWAAVGFAPSLYLLVAGRGIADRWPTWFHRGALAVAALSVGGLTAMALRRRPPWSMENALLTALLTSLMVPFLLPGMHERYFYAADVLSLIYAGLRPRWAWVAVVVITCSTLMYIPYLFGITPVSFRYLSLVLGITVGVVFLEWHNVLRSHRNATETMRELER